MLRKKSLSSTNLPAAENIYNYKSEQYRSQYDRAPVLNRDVIKSSMIIPSQYGKVALDLCIDEIALRKLQDLGCINWCRSARFLLPLETQKDDNSLLHAISLYIFGVHDKDRTLRKLLHQRLFKEKQNEKGPIWTRWKCTQEILEMQAVAYHEAYPSDWQDILELSSDRSFHAQEKENKLVDVHVFTMANILGRPIIVVSDRSSLNSIQLEGIYLPLLRQSRECEMSPIVIAYLDNNFVPLLSSENLHIPICERTPLETALHCAPIVHNDLTPLVIKCLKKEEMKFRNEIVAKYLEVCPIPHDENVVHTAMFKFKPPPAWSIELMWSLFNYSEELALHGLIGNGEGHYAELRPCDRRQVANCQNNASSNKENLCVPCYEQFLMEKKRIPKRNSIKSRSSNLSSSGSFLKACRAKNCDGVGVPELRDLCHSCYGKTIDSILPNLPEPPQPFTLPQSHTNLPTKREEKYDILKEPNIKPRPVKLFSGHSVTNFSGQSVLPFENHVYDIPTEPSELNFDKKASPVSSYRHDGLASTPAAALPDQREKVEAYISSKLLCDVPGCESSPAVGSKHCTVHYEIQSPTRTKNDHCLLEECSNLAGDNNLGLCLFCFNTQMNISKNLEGGSNAGNTRVTSDRRNLGRGPAVLGESAVGDHDLMEFRSLASTLPPLPKPDLEDDFDLPIIPPLPGLENGDFSSGGHHFSTGGRHGDEFHAQSASQFQPPQLYPGFNGTRPTSYGSQIGVTNWQKEKVSSVQKRCLYCNHVANQDKGDLCDSCFSYKINNGGLRKCVNDGCRSPGSEEYNFLCETCCRMQVRDMETANRFPGTQASQPGAALRNNPKAPLVQTAAAANPCKTVGCVRMAVHPQTLCEICQEKVAVNEIGKPCKGLGCKFFGNPAYGGYCSSCFNEKTREDAYKKQKQTGIRTFAPDTRVPLVIPPENVGPKSLPDVYGLVAQERCLNGDCDLYGRPEWNGFCSVCYKKIGAISRHASN